VKLVDTIEAPLKYIKPLSIVSLVITILSGVLIFLSANGHNILKLANSKSILTISAIAGLVWSIYFHLAKRKIKKRRDSIINESKRKRGIL
jgi:divalent metal cation (Fe/Co/Zn/Cd) transporter